MNTRRSKTSWRTHTAFGLFLAVPAALLGADQNNQQSSTTTAAGARSQSEHRLVLSRAEDVIGRDIMGSDGKKAGDIVDLVFDLEGAPEVTHALVMTGGFLDMGGEVRAVPVSALDISQDGESYRLGITKEDYFHAPLVPDDRQRYFSDATLVSSTNEFFSSRTQQSGDSADKAPAKPDRADAQAGQKPDSGALASPVLFSDLNGREVRGSSDRNLGTVTDAWVNLSERSIPLIEMRPGVAIGSPFTTTNTDVRYQLPAAKFENADGTRVHFDVSVSEIESAPQVSELEWANMSDDAYDSVLRLDISELPDRQGKRSS